MLNILKLQKASVTKETDQEEQKLVDLELFAFFHLFGTKVHPNFLDLMFRVIRSIHDYKMALMSPIAKSLNIDTGI